MPKGLDQLVERFVYDICFSGEKGESLPASAHSRFSLIVVPSTILQPQTSRLTGMKSSGLLAAKEIVDSQYFLSACADPISRCDSRDFL
jgi:hypothetical protein